MHSRTLSEIYKDQIVLVTGDTGFKGSWLTLWLTELGARVVGYALDPPSTPNNFTVSGLSERITHVPGDIRDADGLQEVFTRHQPSMVMHLAAQAIVRTSYQSPKETFDTNIGGTVNVLEAVRRHPCVKVLVNVTSDKCYENREWVWGYRENDPMGGYDPYSASKGCAELVFAAYQKSFFSRTERSIGCASVRAGNVIGGGDWAADRLIPDAVRSLAQGQPIPIRNPHAIRPWQHVLEPLGGYIWLGALLFDQPEQYSGAWNFGPDAAESLRVRDVIEHFLAVWGNGSWQDLSSGPPGLHEALSLRLCCDKARAYLQWRAVLSIEECLQMTAAWYRDYYSGRGDMYPVCVEQIRHYMQRLREDGCAWAH